MKTALALSIIILASSLGDVLIAKGMKRVGEIATIRLRELALIGTRIVSNAAFLLGLLCVDLSLVPIPRRRRRPFRHPHSRSRSFQDETARSSRLQPPGQRV